MTTQASPTLVLGGATGLLGQALTNALQERGTPTSAPVLAPTRAELDVTDERALAAYLDRHRPATIYNTVAYTAVDQAEDDVAAATLLNTELPAFLGRVCASRSLLLVHFSTDFVFGGSEETPRTEEDEPEPTSIYGQTKLDGERALLGIGHRELLIIRTAWLFGPGKTNFVHKILGLAKERQALAVVHDQFGSPTYTPDLAAHTLALADSGARGLFHLANAGRASWCELASEAVSAAGLACRVDPVPTDSYPTKAARPAYSVLDLGKFTQATGTTPRPWAQAVREYVYGTCTDCASRDQSPDL